MLNVDAILDIGKTHIRFSLYSQQANRDKLECVQIGNSPLQGELYLASAVEMIWQWLNSQLSGYSQKYRIKRIAISTHGAACALLVNNELAFPVYDYEDTTVELLGESYPKPEFSETYSPDLPAGLNLGRVIYYLSKKYPERFEAVDKILMYPQYWAWRLTGVAVSEVTSLGCHTDLWQPLTEQFSSLVTSQQWQAKFPKLQQAGESLGKVKPDLALRLGLDKDCEVLNGIHDSNAALVPYVMRSKRPLTVISTGTWFIISQITTDFQPKAFFPEKDMLLNVGFNRQAIPSIRFMGGREWQTINPDKSQQATLADVEQIIHKNIFALPSFASSGGPFGGSRGEIVPSAEGINRSALATLYIALVTDYCLDQLGEIQDVFIEGPLVHNDIYAKLLQYLRDSSQIFISGSEAGTSVGLLSLIDGDPSGHSMSPLGPLTKKWPDLMVYKQQWRKNLL